MEQFRRFIAQFREYWAGLSRLRRISVIVAVVGTLLAIGVVVYLTPSSSHPILVTVPIEEVQTITTRLSGASIPYTTENNGTTIRVPLARLDQARAMLAAEGLLGRGAGGKGYELFDESSLTTTPFVQNVNYQRALQSELARLIMQIDAVQTARVMISRPDPTPFIREQRAATASVVLRLKPGATLPRTSAASIVSLVARAVEGLKPENVTIVDSAGRLLSDPNSGERDNLPAPQLEYRRDLENYLSSKAEEMLGRHLGPGRAVVRVSADINFQKLKERRETYQPDGRVAAAERQTTSKTTSASARGVAGATSNISRASGSTSQSGGGENSEEVVQTDYLVSRTVQDLEDRMAAVTRLTIAVLADLAPEEGRTSISVEDAQEITKQAVGFRSGRDEIKLSNVRLVLPEAPPEPDEELAQLQRIQTYVALARNICMALAIVLVIAMVPLLLMRRRPTPEVATPSSSAPAANELDQLIDLAQREPDRVADVFRGLLGGR